MINIELKDYKLLIDLALLEDVGSGDLTSMATLPEDSVSCAHIIAKQQGVVCGLDIAEHVFHAIDPELIIERLVEDGASVNVGAQVLCLKGRSRSILSAERTALNFMARLSGIATETAHYVELVRGTSAKICDTRKTLPAWRKLEKYAVAVGGGHNHRIGLWDAVLIKENHISAAGGIRQALAAAKKLKKQVTFIQIEVENEQQLLEALEDPPDMLLLDNMSVGEMLKSVEICRRINYNILIEASGNINIQNVVSVAQTGVDRISIGAITHSAANFDYSLLIK